jgi:hypothetical protein
MNARLLALVHTIIAVLVFGGVTVASFRAYLASEGISSGFPSLLLLPWVVSAFGLQFGKKWGWWGSLLVVAGLYCVLGYFALAPLPSSAHSDPSGFLMLAWIALAVPLACVLMLLVVIWRVTFKRTQ